MEVRIAHLLLAAVVTVALGQDAVSSTGAGSPTIPAPSRDDLPSQLDGFADLIVKKYSASNASQLNPVEFTRLWTSLLATNNRSSHSTPAASIPTVCANRGDANTPLCQSISKCTEPKRLFDLVTGNGGVQLNGAALKEVCPLILHQLESGLCEAVTLDSDGRPEVTAVDAKKKPTTAEVWGYGVLFVTIISCCSLAGVSLLPLMGKAFYSKMLTVMVGLAVGSLSGSSAFHLIPQAFGLLDSDPEHSYLQTSLLLWVGIWMFFMIERFLKIIMDAKQRKVQREKAIQPNSWPLVEQGRPAPSGLRPSIDKCQPREMEASPELCLGTEVDKIYESQEQVIKASFGHQVKPQRSHSHERIIHFKSGDSPIQTVAWMIIFGDGFHNFIDGLSLGAAFGESITTGMSISIAVMCEELPHELGDFAVLLSAGMTMRQALIYNFLSACTCYLGLALGIVLGEFEASSYIFALAGGMFLYISLVDMVPEMNEVAEEASSVSTSEALKILALQNVGMLFGVLALFVLAKFQDQISFG